LHTQGNGSAPSEGERTVTLLTAAECREKAEQKMVEARNAADARQHHELEATAKAWLVLAERIAQTEAVEALKAGRRSFRTRPPPKLIHVVQQNSN
jgi:hypothetical protein